MTTLPAPMSLLDALSSPSWVNTSGRDADTAWWPLGRLQYDKEDGTPVDTVLVLRLGESVGLHSVDPQTQVHPCRTSWAEPSSLGGDVAKFLELGAGMLAGDTMELGYRKAGDGPVQTRRVRRVVPRADGRAVTVHDLDRDAARSFRLDRVVWVRRVASE